MLHGTCNAHRGIGLSRIVGNHAAEHRIHQRQIQTVEFRIDQKTAVRGAEKTADHLLGRPSVKHVETHPLGLEIPSAFEQQRCDTHVVHVHAVHHDMREQASAAKSRRHVGIAVGASADTIAHLARGVEQRTYVEIVQRKTKRILGIARGHAVHPQQVVSAAYGEIPDYDALRIVHYAAGHYLPAFVSSRNVRGRKTHRNPRASVFGLRHVGPQAQQRREPFLLVGKHGGKIDMPVLRTAHHGQVGQKEFTRIEILGIDVQRKRIAAIAGRDVHLGHQYILVLHVIRPCGERKLFGVGVEHERQRSSRGELHVRHDGRKQAVRILHIERKQRIAAGVRSIEPSVTGIDLLARTPFVEHRQISSEESFQIVEHIAVAESALELDVHEFGREVQIFAVFGILAGQLHGGGCERIRVVNVPCIGNLDITVQVIHSDAVGMRRHDSRKHRHRIARIDSYAGQIGGAQIQRHIVPRDLRIEVHHSAEIEIQIRIGRDYPAVEAAVFHPAVHPYVVIAVSEKLRSRDFGFHRAGNPASLGKRT